MTDHGDLRLERLGPDTEHDFLALMARDEVEGSHCWCVAWWVPDWPTYQANTPDQNRAVRDDLFARSAAISVIMLVFVAIVIVPYLISNLRSENEL